MIKVKFAAVITAVITGMFIASDKLGRFRRLGCRHYSAGGGPRSRSFGADPAALRPSYLCASTDL